MAEPVDPFTKSRPKDSEESRMPDDNDYLKLRQLLLGDDYASALQRYISKEEDAERVAKVLAQAIELSNQKDDSLGEALSPAIDKAIGSSIEENPKRITNIIFPVMGPAIRKAVASALTEMVQSLNTLLEQSLTFKSLNWRISAWRSGVPYGQYVLLQTIQFRVEQVFLVHRETGLLLNSMTAKEVSAQDPELVSSMLTAISDFVSDSFVGERNVNEDTDTLERIRFGQLELLLFSGPFATLALAVRGSASDELSQKAHHVIEVIHERYAKSLSNFEGDRTPFEPAESLLSECLLSKRVEPTEKKKPWLAILVILMALAFMAQIQYERYEHSSILNKVEQRFQEEDSYILLEFEPNDTGAKLVLLRGTESRDPELLLSELELTKPDGISLTIEVLESVVHFGPLPEPPKPNLPAPKSLQERYADLVFIVENHTFYFEPKSTELSEQELMKVPMLVQAMKELESALEPQDKQILQFSVMGFADNQGTEYGNKTVSRKRADMVRNMLTENGISSEMIVAWGGGNIDRESLDEKYQRRVNIMVTPKSLDLEWVEGKQESVSEMTEH